MENKVDILNELKAISPMLAGMEKVNVFTVPEGYFNYLGEDILSGIKSNNNSILHTIPANLQANVPAGYFDHLADTIISRIKAEQTQSTSVQPEALSPVLYSLKTKNVFKVPQGYFETVADAILAKIQTQPSKLVVMRKRSTVFMKYAVAAVFTGMMALGVFKFIKPTDTVIPAKLDAVVADGYQIYKAHTFDQEFAKVSDEDIIKYLQANGENVDAQTIADQTLDANSLPSQADYLMDDKALDKYLDNINNNDLKN